MKSLLFICVGFIVVVQSFAMNVSDVDFKWENYKRKFSKSYTEKEEKDRKKIWEANLKMVEEHNNGNHSYTVAINNLSDLTLNEYKNLILADLEDSDPSNETLTFYNPTKSISLPSEVDWRTKGYVTRVKNQGQCGSCWAFSATGSLEGQHFNMTNKLVSLSEQNLVDCSGPYGNSGCDGGLPNRAFEYVIGNGGIDTEASYPYKAKSGRCKYSASSIGAKCSGYKNIKRGSESDLQCATAEIGPISVLINARSWGFQHYRSGVFNQPNCGNSRNELDHAVLVVGYGATIDGTKYWLVKNSWGTSWGSEGYIKMSRNEDNQCGIATQASFPLVPRFTETAAPTTSDSGGLKLQSCLVTVMVFLFGLFSVLQ